MLSESELERLKSIDRAASKEWRWLESESHFDSDGDYFIQNDSGQEVLYGLTGNDADDEIIVEARNALPKLLAEIDQLKAENKHLSSISSTVVAAIWEQGRISAQIEHEANHKKKIPTTAKETLAELVERGHSILDEAPKDYSAITNLVKAALREGWNQGHNNGSEATKPQNPYR